ncbi:hypothetical protein [Hymenobacter terrenus]|uniref:hypothetical protein n=1 Tax=Hymenobacter terrenus TaxID=1629124 RepID=UPI000619640C|nr:hypothetical protein [Hymenobacter terrenus]
MEPIHPDYKCHADELVPLARLLRVSVERDLAALTELLPDDYDKDYLTRYDAAVAAAVALVPSSVQLAKGMVVTQHLQELYTQLPALLDRLAARVRRAEGLTVPATRFGIEAARRARNHNEKVALAAGLKTTLQNIAANEAALAKKGQKPEDTAQLQELYDDLVTNTTTQGAGTSTQKSLTQENIKVLNALYAFMQLVLADGKALYRTSDKAKLADYTFKQLLKRVRRDRQGDTAAKKGKGKGNTEAGLEQGS